MNKHTFSGNSFIAFAIAAAGAAAVPATAATTIVLDRSLPPEVKVTGTRFDVDEKLGRVHLAVDLYDESFSGNSFSETVVVPGLTFDRERREVRCESGGPAVHVRAAQEVPVATHAQGDGRLPDHRAERAANRGHRLQESAL